MDASRAVEIERRWKTFRLLAPYFGKVVTAKFIQKTAEFLPGLVRVHNLIEGIYKPKQAHYGFAIASMLKNPYADRISFNPDRSWYFYYSAKAGALDSAVNQSLFNCLRDKEPVLVLKQLTDKTARQGTTYKILGLGQIEEFDQSERLFRIRELTIAQFQKRIDPKSETLSDDLIETALQLETLEAWSPFVAEDRIIYQVSKAKRHSAFRKIVLENYSQTCAVTGSRFTFGSTAEAEAAHIIGKDANGSDDPRNGLALSQTAHWAFDRGIFTLSDQYEIQIHSKVTQANTRLFPLIGLDGKRIHLPSDEAYHPHPEALEWHRNKVFGQFAR